MTISRQLRRAVRGAREAMRRRRPVTRRDVVHFLRALKGPCRTSAARAFVDGAYVFLTLERRGLRPLVHDRSDLPDADPESARQAAAAVDAGLGVLPVQATCLRRSMTLLRELHRQKRGAVLHIGVRPGRGGIEAHAWVQVAGEVVNDDPELIATYTELSAGEAERLMPRFV